MVTVILEGILAASYKAKLSLVLPYDPIIALLGAICLAENLCPPKTCRGMLIESVFLIIKSWKQLKKSLLTEGISKL